MTALDLSLHTDSFTIYAIGGAVGLILAMFAVGAMHRIARRTQESSEYIVDGLRALSRDIAVKDFSFKPKFDETNGGLKIGPGYHQISSMFPTQYYL